MPVEPESGDAESGELSRAEETRRQLAEADEQAMREAEERERARLTGEAAGRERRAEEAGQAKWEAEKEAELRRMQAPEEQERRNRAAREAESARRMAEAEERARRDAAELEMRQEKERAEKAILAAREEELAIRTARIAEMERRAAEVAELAVLEAEADNRPTQEELSRRMDESAEQARTMARQVEQARKEAAAIERSRSAAEEEERRLQGELAEERARRMAEAAERARRMAEEVEAARRSAEEREAALLASPEKTGDGDASPEAFRPETRSEDTLVADTPPVLEVDNPYWEKTPRIFEMLSGAPHGPAAQGQGGYGQGDGMDNAFPVSIEPGIRDREPPGPRPDSVGDDACQPDFDATLPVPPEKRMYIVMITPEVAPCAKVGGLGDVILGLGRELMKRGHGVEVICPMYAGMRYDQITGLHEEYSELWCPHYNEWRAEKVFKGTVEGGLPVNFITGGTYTERENIYGYDDDLYRFTYFSRQALEFMYKTNRRPDIIHCHDWATGLVPAILWDIYQKLGWDNSRAVYTIHNNECQGLCGFGDKLLGLVGLDVKKYHTPDRMQDDAHKNCINMMKAGIVFSNFVTTVSPTYAGELKTVAGGRGLQHTIARNSVKVGGVLNGIDYDSWNPKTDPKLTAHYSVGEDFFEKYQNKKALRERLGLYDAWKPIVSVVTRLTHQKGLDLIKAAIFQTLELQGQFVLLGSAPDPRVNADFLRLQHDLKDNHDVNLFIGYHEDLSRLIYAGSDMFLIPSLYEPCGLTQMISLRYGTVPIVRETGGLVDTVFDVDNSGRGLNDANGFTFRDPNPVSLKYGLERAINLWYGNPEAFNRLAKNGMRYDYSWRHPAEHYENIYNYVKA